MKRKSKRKYVSGVSYYASISDLMSCLVFIFIITIVALAITLRDHVKESNEAKTEYSNSLEARNQLMRKIRDDLQKMKIRVFVDDENGIISFPESTIFSSGEASVSNVGQAVFKQVGTSLNKYLECNSKEQIKYLCDGSIIRVDSIIVEGHADPSLLKGRLKRKHRSNLNLSLKRALNTYTLIDEEFDSDLFLNSKGEGIMGAAGYGSLKPPRKLAGNVYDSLFENDLSLSKKMVQKYNDLKTVDHNHKIGKLIDFLKLNGRKEKKKELVSLTFRSFRRIDLRFIMSLPKILKEKDGKISSEDNS